MVSPPSGRGGYGGNRARFRGGVWRTAVGDRSEKLRGAPHPGPGPEQPRSRPRGADPWVANFPRPSPRAPRRHGGSLGLVCVPEGVSVRAGRREGVSLPGTLEGRRRDARPAGAPAAACGCASRNQQTPDRLSLESDWRGSSCPKAKRLLRL